MNFRKRKIFLTAFFLFFSVRIFSLPHFLWDNQEGVKSEKGCSLSSLEKNSLRISHYWGLEKKATENLRNYNGVRQSHLVNFSMVKLIKGKERRNYKKIEVVGINTKTRAKVNRWFSERGDQGYLYRKSLLSLDDFVLRIKGNELRPFGEILKRNIQLFDEREDIYLRVVSDQSYYKLNCGDDQKRDYLVFRAYQKGHGERALFLIGLSSQETQLLKKFAVLSKAKAMEIIPSIDGQDKLSLGTLSPNILSSDELERERGNQEEGDGLVDPQQLGRVEDLGASMLQLVCIKSKTLNVRDESLERVLFKAKKGENVKIFQSWDGEEMSKVIRGEKYSFIKVKFSQREEGDQNIGYVASSFIKAEENCPHLRREGRRENREIQISGLDDENCCQFPTAQNPTHSYLTGMRRFGAHRSSGERRHAACDLYRYENEPIKAVAPGIVLRNLYYFYQGTYALEVRHSGGFIARYGEMTSFRQRGVRRNRPVRMGQRLGKMGKVNSNCCRPMLHFELYRGTESGSLSVTGRRPYRRRGDLLDPTDYLERWERKSF